MDVLWARGLLCPFQKNSINTPLRVNLTGRHEVCALETAHSTRWTVVLHTDGFLRSPPLCCECVHLNSTQTDNDNPQVKITLRGFR